MRNQGYQSGAQEHPATGCHSESNGKQMKAEGDKESRVSEAEASKQAVILAAETEKEKGIKAIREASADDSVIRLKSLEAFEKAADGKATRIIIPSEIASAAVLAKGIVESVKDDDIQ